MPYAIEFAITFPFFIFVTAGMIDAAWMVMQQSAYDSAAHLGCRDGSKKDPGFALANIATVKSCMKKFDIDPERPNPVTQ